MRLRTSVSHKDENQSFLLMVARLEIEKRPPGLFAYGSEAFDLDLVHK